MGSRLCTPQRPPGRRHLMNGSQPARPPHRYCFVVPLAVVVLLLTAGCGYPIPTSHAAGSPAPSRQVQRETTQWPTRRLNITCTVLLMGTCTPEFRLQVQAATTTCLTTMTVVAFNAAGAELGSTDVTVGEVSDGEVIVGGQMMMFWSVLPSDLLVATGSMDSGGSEIYTTNAAKCEVVGYS
jgi:hypothetical protein